MSAASERFYSRGRGKWYASSNFKQRDLTGHGRRLLRPAFLESEIAAFTA
jgi:hypothetical protein